VTRSGTVRWLRRAQLALTVLGVSLLGGALAAVVHSWVYQARQGRAFAELEREAGAPVSDRVASSTPPAAAGRSPLLLAADPLLLGRIEIPRVGVSAVVREGDDDPTLAVAVGHVPGTAGPGERSNMVLAGHRDSFFRGLRRIRVDDVIHFRAVSGRYEYRVESTEVVRPDETRVLAPTGDAVLTLVTCYPFGYVGHAPNRFIVRARLVLPRAAPP
jgi:sortase A